MISLAGPETEAAFTGTYDADAAQEDIERALDHARQVAGDENEASRYVEWLQARTLNLMKAKEFWAAVEALVSELLENREVSYIKAKRIIERGYVTRAARPGRDLASARSRPELEAGRLARK